MQELASCVCNYAQVRGCKAVCLGQGFEARKEGRKREEEVGRAEVGGEIKRERTEKERKKQ